jgi:hypothetical protein
VRNFFLSFQIQELNSVSFLGHAVVQSDSSVNGCERLFRPCDCASCARNRFYYGGSGSGGGGGGGCSLLAKLSACQKRKMDKTSPSLQKLLSAFSIGSRRGFQTPYGDPSSFGICYESVNIFIFDFDFDSTQHHHLNGLQRGLVIVLRAGLLL